MSDYPSGIRAVGAYAPALRIEAAELEAGWGEFRARNVTEKAVPDADEDAVTMAFEAAHRGLEAGGVDPSSVDQLLFASTTPPVAEEELTTHLAAMLGVPGAAVSETLTGSTNAGVRALRRGLQTADRTLAIASDCPRGEPEDALEHAAGAGAAAFVLEPGGGLVVGDAGADADAYSGTRYRQHGTDRVDSLDVTAYERSALAAVIGAAAEDVATAPDGLDAAAIHAPDGATPYRVAGTLGVDRAAVDAALLVDELGDAGAAGVPLALAKAIDDGGSDLLAVGFGSGATATILRFRQEGTTAVASTLALGGDRYLSFAEYIRRRGDITSGAPEGGGAYVSVPTWQRSLPQRYRLEAGRCPDCDAVNLPPTGACTSCRSLVDYERVELSRTGSIETLSVISQGGAPPEFAELQAMYGGTYTTCIVAFDGPAAGAGSSLPALVVGTDNDDLSVGDEVRATMRRIYTQEGVTRYGLKVEPTPGS